MKTLATISACALMALAIPAFAQMSPDAEMKNNGSPSGVSPSHAKQPGDRGAESGKAPMTEGRSSATDSNGNMGATGKTGTGVGTQNGNMAPGGGPGESGGGAAK